MGLLGDVRDIRSWLEAQDTKIILDMLMAQVTSNGRLREELVLKITKEKAVSIDLNAYRKELRTAFHTGGGEYALCRPGSSRTPSSLPALWRRRLEHQAPRSAHRARRTLMV
jgi:hypothetical protein